MNLPVPSPTRLGKYELLDELGHGGMATVYRAFDPRLERHVAVKVIHRHLRESAEVARRFVAEARAVAKLRHPNIVEIYDVAEENVEERFLVAELVQGESLRSVLSKHPVLPAEVAACIALEMTGALAHAHKRGVIHRDVKPENILFGFPAPSSLPPHSIGSLPTEVTRRAIAIKITDFGIAKMLDQQGVTSTGQVLGSPAYMAPEQIECADVDERVDVFALGVVLYECMVGRLPFEGSNPAQVLRRVLDGSFAPADEARPQVGASWAVIVARALAHEAAQRYATMNDFRTALLEELMALGIDDPPGEIAAFFADPAAYEQRNLTRLVPQLLARGRRDHRARNVVAAAGHFNRALAFTPDDPTVLALVMGLARRRAWRTLLVRLSLVGVAGGTIGLAAWGTTRVLHRRQTGLSAPASDLPSARASAAAMESVATPLLTASSPPNLAAGANPPRPRTTGSTGLPGAGASSLPSPSTGAPPSSTLRNVDFFVNPKSALVSIDDGPAEEAFGLGRRTLPVGRHSLKAFPKEGNPCCESLDRAFEIHATADGTDPQRITVSLPFRDARLTSQGPATALVVCPSFRVNGAANGTFAIKMSTTEEVATCTLRENGTEVETQAITLRAGQGNTILWRSAGGR